MSAIARCVIPRQRSNLVAVGGEGDVAHGSDRTRLCAAAAAEAGSPTMNRASLCVASRHFFLDNASYFRLLRAILLIESRGTLLETIPEAEQARFPRAGLVTPHSGGPGIVPAGITTGERGAPLKRE
jgi:hypothetical protein